MGNEQKKVKIYKVLNVKHDFIMFEKFVKCDLDDYVVYKDGNYKSICYLYSIGSLYNVESTLPSKWEDWKESYCAASWKPITLSELLIGGQWLPIDLNRTCNYEHDHRFVNWLGESEEAMGVKNHYGEIGKGKVRDSRGNLLEGTGDFLKEYNEANQRYADMAESARYQNQVVQRWTSWDMPPKW